MVFYHPENGSILREFDYSKEKGVKAMTVARCSCHGKALVVGNWNRFFVFALLRWEYLRIFTLWCVGSYSFGKLLLKKVGSQRNVLALVDNYLSNVSHEHSTQAH